MSTETAGARAYRDAPMPDPEANWRDVDFGVIDLEMTGLNAGADEIISFAVIPVSGGRVRLQDSRYQLIRPRKMPAGESIRIHGLRAMDLEQAPPLAEVVDDLLEAIAGRALVAHVAAVETSFLTAALGHYGLELRNPMVDTAAIANELLRRTGRWDRERGPIGLTELARTFHLPVHRPHHADGDALTTAQLFLALSTHLDKLEPLTLGTMQGLDLTAPRRGLTLRRLRDTLIRSSARP